MGNFTDKQNEENPVFVYLRPNKRIATEINEEVDTNLGYWMCASCHVSLYSSRFSEHQRQTQIDNQQAREQFIDLARQRSIERYNFGVEQTD